MPDITVPLHSRRFERMQLVQGYQHAIPAGALWLDGLQALGRGEQGLAFGIAAIEVAMGGVVLFAMLRSLRQLRGRKPGAPASPHAVDWIEVGVAGVLAVEALAHWQQSHHWRRPTILMAMIVLAQGLLHGRLHTWMRRRRSLRITNDGVNVGGSPLRRFSATWLTIARIDLSAGDARIVFTSGRERRIDLKDLHNADAVRDALQSAKHHLHTLEASAAPTAP